MPAAALSFRVQNATDATPGIGEAIQRLLSQSESDYVAPSPEVQHLCLAHFFGPSQPNHLAIARAGDYAEGLIIGLADMAVLKTLDDQRLTIIQHLVVDQNYRNHGVGRQLLEYLLQEVAHHGGGRVILGCKHLGGDIPDLVADRLLATATTNGWITITEGDNPLAGEVPRFGLL